MPSKVILARQPATKLGQSRQTCDPETFFRCFEEKS